MTTVRFAITCAHCGARSRDNGWGGCRVCLKDICSDCAETETVIRRRCMGAEPERDDAYERAAARDRLDGFRRTNGKDWT